LHSPDVTLVVTIEAHVAPQVREAFLNIAPASVRAEANDHWGGLAARNQTRRLSYAGAPRGGALTIRDPAKMGELRHEIRSCPSCVAVGSDIERRRNANAQTPVGAGVWQLV